MSVARYQKLDKKRDDFGATSKLLEKTNLTEADVGKIFYTDPGKKNGKIVSAEDFLKLDPEDIGGWIAIGELDIKS
jgi:hypothetical protein